MPSYVEVGAYVVRTLHPDNARIAADHLTEAFIWRNTEEGYEFWERVYSHLMHLSRSKQVIRGYEQSIPLPLP